MKKAAVFPEPITKLVLSPHSLWCMSPTSLSNGDQIVTLQNGWNRVGLNGSGDLVATETNVAQHDRVKTRIIKVDNWRWPLSRLGSHLDLFDTEKVVRS